MTAICTSILTFGFSYNSLIISLIFISMIPILFLFSTKKMIPYPNLKRRNNELKFYKEELIIEEKTLISKRESLEKKLERITHFYIISKDLTKNIDVPEDIANALLNVLETRVGVCYVVITTKNNNLKEPTQHLKIMSRINEQKKEQWTSLINNNSEILSLKGPAIIKSLFKIENKPVIAWPIILDNQLNSCTFLVVEPEYSQIYLEEGELFIPHLKLGTKRIMLFSELKKKARIDGLTGLFLKRFFLEKLYSEIERAKRYNTDFYVMMLDIDHFKSINDNYGHLVGDDVLKKTTSIISSSVRHGDIIGRYGGEEFIVLLPSISQDNVLETAEKIRKSVKNIVFKGNNKPFSITISIGLAKYLKGIDIDTLIGNADNALYQAKNSGRDNIILYDNSND
jgi:diguanylate cyclase (GGDEF)-like protein